MLATVRLNDELTEILNSIAERYHKKKSDVIREAIRFYAKELEKTQQTRMQKAIQKCAKSDLKEYKDIEGTLDDGI